MYPENLRYTAEHEWLRDEGDGTVVVGITDFAQHALGDIVYVNLPGVGTALVAGEPCGEVESTKSVSDVYAPASGEVVAVNPDLESAPELINASPYADGWLLRMTVSEALPDSLLDAAQYAAQLVQR